MITIYRFDIDKPVAKFNNNCYMEMSDDDDNNLSSILVYDTITDEDNDDYGHEYLAGVFPLHMYYAVDDVALSE